MSVPGESGLGGLGTQVGAHVPGPCPRAGEQPSPESGGPSLSSTCLKGRGVGSLQPCSIQNPKNTEMGLEISLGTSGTAAMPRHPTLGLSSLSEAALAIGSLCPQCHADCCRKHLLPWASSLHLAHGAQVDMTPSPGFGDLRPPATAFGLLIDVSLNAGLEEPVGFLCRHC